MKAKEINIKDIRVAVKKMVDDKNYILGELRSGKSLKKSELKKRGLEVVNYDIPSPKR